MKKIMNRSLKALTLMIATTLTMSANAQTTFNSKAVTITISGTSTLHDWEEKGSQGAGQAAFDVDAKGNVTSMTKLSFSIPAKSIKSEHDLMDKNTYKALDADNHPNISFALTSATISNLGNGNYQIRCIGKLSIAGTTKDTDLVANGKYNPADGSLTVTGVKKMKMTDYNVKPPTVMMGTIKTGNDISISFNVRFTK